MHAFNLKPLPDVFEVPLFPLPNTVLFPGTILPLHIFEPRYRMMLEAAMAGEKLIAMAFLMDGWQKDYYGTPDVHPVAGVGRVIAHHPRPDGTVDIALMGLARAKIQEEWMQVDYRVATVQRLDDYPPDELEDFEAELSACHTLERSAEGLMKRLLDPDAMNKVLEHLAICQGAGRKADLLASMFVKDIDTRQALMENLDGVSRAKTVCERLERMATRIEPQAPPQDGRLDDVCLN